MRIRAPTKCVTTKAHAFLCPTIQTATTETFVTAPTNAMAALVLRMQVILAAASRTAMRMRNNAKVV